MEYATKLRVMRTIRGLQQREVEELAGLPQTLITAIETGKVLPSDDYDRRLREAVAWPPDELAERAFAILETGVDPENGAAVAEAAQ